MTFQPATQSAMPVADVVINEQLVRELICTQAPRWDSAPLSYLDTGWDNVVYRLGNDLLVRLPRRALAEQIGMKERACLPRMAADSGLNLGIPEFIGTPTTDYPFTFSICPYVSGVSAAQLPRVQRDSYALDLAEYFRTLHCPAPDTAPRSEFRGCELVSVDSRTRRQIAQLSGINRQTAEMIWSEALAAEPYSGPALWLHGDPHPHNTIVDTGNGGATFSALVDFGDLCVGDPASDLGMLWMHFSQSKREEALESLGVKAGSAQWLRARGWALRYAMITAPLGVDDLLGRIGRVTLNELLRA